MTLQWHFCLWQHEVALFDIFSTLAYLLIICDVFVFIKICLQYYWRFVKDVLWFGNICEIFVSFCLWKYLPPKLLKAAEIIFYKASRRESTAALPPKHHRPKIGQSKYNWWNQTLLIFKNFPFQRFKWVKESHHSQMIKLSLNLQLSQLYCRLTDPTVFVNRNTTSWCISMNS